MDVTVRVGVATHRPPAEHASVYVKVTVDVHGLDLHAAEVRAKDTAACMAACHPHVVMPVSTTIIDIDNL